MRVSVTIKLGPSVEAGGQRGEVPLRGVYVPPRCQSGARLEAGEVRPPASGMRRRSTSTWHEHQFASKAHPWAVHDQRASPHGDNPQKSLMFRISRFAN